MGELQTMTREQIAAALRGKQPPPQPPPQPVRWCEPCCSHRPRLVDVDMGINRDLGYRDPRRLGSIRVWPHAEPELTGAGRVGVTMALIRREAGATQQAVSRVLGTSQNIVSRWERDTMWTPSHVRATWAQVCRQAVATQGMTAAGRLGEAPSAGLLREDLPQMAAQGDERP